MRRYFFAIFLSLFLGGFFIFPRVVFAEEITDYRVSFSVQKDGKIVVTENIHYDFGDASRHGIFRSIPVRSGSIFSPRVLGVTVDSVEDDRGLDYHYTVHREGDDLVIKVGDAEKLITGQHNYIFRYTVENALNFFDDHDELYWNVVGNEWPVVIRSAQADVFLQDIPLNDQVRMSCFTGYAGSTDSFCSASFSDTSVHFETRDFLRPGAGLTIVVGWPKGFIANPRASHTILFWLAAYDWFIAAVLIPLFVFLFLLWRWFRFGRDFHTSQTLIAQYEPPDGLNPLEAGTLFDFRADPRDITALLLDLAVRGYIKIRFIPKQGVFGHDDYEFVKLKEPNTLTKICEHDFFDALFDNKKSVFLSSLKYVFYKHAKDLKDHVYDTLSMEDYFLKDPSKVRNNHYVLSFSLVFFSFVIFFTPYPAYALSLLLSALLIAIFASFMPARTKKGVAALQHLSGFRLYLEVAERDRIRFHNAPEKKPQQFEQWLAFAVMFGVEKEWAKQFASLHVVPPKWYDDPRGFHHFSTIVFVSHMSEFSHSFFRVASHGAAAGKSGFSGGSSGGGFGGGGGGSW